MTATLDRTLTRLWLSLAAPFVLAACLHLGARVGAGRWPDLAPGSVAAAPRPGALSPGAMEPPAGSPVEGCNRRLIYEKFCRFPPAD
ncbi:hypothetical protein [Methylobacterium sp. J-076]|uniref:hypothetical protein n=1 Tax=Methylobacterium sp. J-076 TaxID=2836655 RepID=UPI001FBB8D7C|nr:hypothetical protein [Methylobacterium sp. J-076]MCJ2011214.1 hypothetical protein [Methylobacterium sp. J-076]